MIFVCFVVFTFLFVAFFGGGKLSLYGHENETYNSVMGD